MGHFWQCKGNMMHNNKKTLYTEDSGQMIDFASFSFVCCVTGDVSNSTFVQATSWEVERAHWVAAAITRFCNMVSSATWATFLAFRTNIAAALATALARFIRVSCNILINVLHLHTCDWRRPVEPMFFCVITTTAHQDRLEKRHSVNSLFESWNLNNKCQVHYEV